MRRDASLTRTDPFDGAEVWFLTGSQGLYGEEPLQQVAEQSQRVAAALDAADAVPARVVWKPVLKDGDAIRRAMGEANEDPNCLGVVTWMHTFSPAKMWISGIDALRKPLLHLHTQADAALPWATIDMDFMNLNQAAPGDREYGFVLTRLRQPRTTVAGHVSHPRVQARVGSWVRAAAGARAAAPLQRARLCPRRAVAEAGPLRRQHAQRRGDRVGQGRGRAAVRRLGEHVGGQRPGGGRRRGAGEGGAGLRRGVRGPLRHGRRPAAGRRAARQRPLPGAHR